MSTTPGNEYQSKVLTVFIQIFCQNLLKIIMYDNVGGYIFYLSSPSEPCVFLVKEISSYVISVSRTVAAELQEIKSQDKNILITAFA